VEATREEAEKKRRGAKEPEPSYLHLLLAKWAERLKPHLPEGMRADLEQRIVQAGGLDELTPAQLIIYATGASILGLAFGLFVVLATGWSAFFVLGSVLVGILYPFVWLRDQVKRRHLEILADLPYHLDLLTLCVEAGMDFGAAVQRMVDRGKPGALRQEFATFIAQLRVGKTRAEALQSMSERVGLEQLSSFLAALIQADRMGSGLGSTLRQQADQLRTERFQRAERLAGEAPVKMLIPLVLFIFPTIWVILGAPIVFDWIFRGGP
jgi:tight adherence protein C